MQFYAASKGNIAPEDLELFGKIRTILENLPDIIFDPTERDWGACKNQFSCHLICRALARNLTVSYRDGYFCGSYEHCWLIPESGSSIIDAYPVAGATPFIVVRAWPSPWAKVYKELSIDEPNDFRSNFVFAEFQTRLNRTSKAVSDTMQKLGLFVGP